MSSNNIDFSVSGGQLSGEHLFHSFTSFSIPTNGSATFAPPSDVRNVFGRVTGTSRSMIDGVIAVQGDANLFLLNPNGYWFGPNAELNLGGSFLASSATALTFTDDTTFSTTPPTNQPLLTVGQPLGLQLSARSQSISISNRSSGTEPQSRTRLKVSPLQTLAFVGNTIVNQDAALVAPAGQVELGSVTGPSLVTLDITPTGFTLNYDAVPATQFRDITLEKSGISTFDPFQGSGAIHLNGRQIALSDRSSLFALNLGRGPGGEIDVRATETITLSDSASILTPNGAAGPGGNIHIAAQQLHLRDAMISASAQPDSMGAGGQIELVVDTAIHITDAATVSTSTTSGAAAGNITLHTGQLHISAGGSITSSTFASGQGGLILITASEQVRVTGSPNNEPSGVIARSSGEFLMSPGTVLPEVTGQSGSIEIHTPHLMLDNGAQITVAAEQGSEGAAGDLRIRASDLIQLTGNAGLIADTEQTVGGNIELTTGTLMLREQSEITTNAVNFAAGGNISIDADLLLTLDDSQITANAQFGSGGQININAAGIFQSLESSISAISTQNPMLNGEVNINVETDPSKDVTPLPGLVPGPAAHISRGCSGQGQNRFVVTGSGGITPTTEDVLQGAFFWRDLRLPQVVQSPEDHAAAGEPVPWGSVPQPVVEAQGWRRLANGQLMLVSRLKAPMVAAATTLNCEGQA